MKFRDYYQVLGVQRAAGEADIKKAYRRLARKYHPDVSKESNAEEHFKEVNEAYEVLRDPEKRKAYDQLGANWKAGQDFRPPPDWEQAFGGGGPGFGGGGGFGGSFSEFFESLFGGGGPGAGRAGFGGGFRAKGPDQQASIQVDLEELYRGTTKTVRLGSGRAVQVKIPAGLAEGQQIRLGGQGGPGAGGGPSGDLYLRVRVRPHAVFRLDGRDVLVDLPVAPWEAALGASIEVPTLAGKVEMKVPAGSRSGSRLRLKGRGLPGKPPGDQFVVIQIVTPPADSPAVRDFYERMQREIPFDPRAHLR
jgi:curved DNA-binding protein